LFIGRLFKHCTQREAAKRGGVFRREYSLPNASEVMKNRSSNHRKLAGAISGGYKPVELINLLKFLFLVFNITTPHLPYVP